MSNSIAGRTAAVLGASPKSDRYSHMALLRLQDAGHRAIAVSAFLPIDMGDEIKGMLGEVDHRRAAVEAGIGVYGMNNLLVTEKFGPRVRLATVLTTASITPGFMARSSIICPFPLRSYFYLPHRLWLSVEFLPLSFFTSYAPPSRKHWLVVPGPSLLC